MRTVILAGVLAVCAVSGGRAQDDESNGGAQYTAVALSPGGLYSRAVAAQVEIDIDRWSTPAERERLVASIGKGQRTMLEVLQDLPRVGSIRTPGDLGLSLHYAHQTRMEDGRRRIFLVTDRVLGFAEVWYQSRTVDYPFTLVELLVGEGGEGTGTLSLAAKVTATGDGRFVRVENWDTNPIQLTQVKYRR